MLRDLREKVLELRSTVEGFCRDQATTLQSSLKKGYSSNSLNSDRV